MLSYCSLEYLVVFLPAVLILYQILPKKARRYWLLAASYLFFWYLSGLLVLWNVALAVIIYLTGRRLEGVIGKRDLQLKQAQRDQKKQIRARCEREKRLWMILAAVAGFGILVTLKYSAFFAENLNALLRMFHAGGQLRIPEFLVPIGISFYTLQGMSYVFDVQKEKIRADRNFLRVALFLSFFPLLMEGPIARYGEIAQQLWECPGIRLYGLQRGGWRILYGIIKKLVVADRVNAAVELLYTDFAKYDAGMVFLAALLFTCQEYMEFSGTMDIVIGTGECLGIVLPENFRQPFFSGTISEFWTRWHMSLGGWLRDYIYYPLSLSKPMKELTKKCRAKLGNHYGPMVTSTIALFAVWLFNGLWHGAGWSFIFFGMYHFALIVTGNLLQPAVIGFCEKHGIDRQKPWYRGFQIVRTFLLVSIGEMFFRALSLKHGLSMFARMISRPSIAGFLDGTMFQVEMDPQDYVIVVVTVLFVFVISLLQEKGYKVRDHLMAKNLFVRSMVTVGLAAFLILFGAYGAGYVPVDPIYANF